MISVGERGFNVSVGNVTENFPDIKNAMYYVWQQNFSRNFEWIYEGEVVVRCNAYDDGYYHISKWGDNPPIGLRDWAAVKILIDNYIHTEYRNGNILN